MKSDLLTFVDALREALGLDPLNVRASRVVRGRRCERDRERDAGVYQSQVVEAWEDLHRER